MAYKKVLSSIKKSITASFQIFLFNKNAIKKVSKEPLSFIKSITAILVTSVIISAIFILKFILSYDLIQEILPQEYAKELSSIISFERILTTFIFSSISLILALLLNVLVIHIMARVLGGKSSFWNIYRPFSLLLITNIFYLPLIFIPYLSFLTPFFSLWLILIIIYIIKIVYSLPIYKAVVSLFLPYIIISVLFSIVKYLLF